MKFASRMRKYLGKPFVKGGIDERGYDCMGLIYAYCRDNNTPIPDSFGEINLHNYAEFYVQDKAIVEQALREYFATIGRHVPVQSVVAGDLLIMQADAGLFPAIFCGNGKFITSYTDGGVRVYEFSPRVWPVMARRMR